jgi:hypothetical protein
MATVASGHGRVMLRNLDISSGEFIYINAAAPAADVNSNQSIYICVYTPDRYLVFGFNIQRSCKGPTPINNRPPVPIANPTHQTLQARDINNVKYSLRRIIFDIEAFQLRNGIVKDTSPDRCQDNRRGLVKPKISAGTTELDQVNMLKLTVERLEFVFRSAPRLACILVDQHLILE